MSPKSKVQSPKSTAPIANGQRFATAARLVLDSGAWIEDHRARRPALDFGLWTLDYPTPC